MNEYRRTMDGGIGFTGILQIAFIVLKLLGKIDWPWLWVLAPTWITAATVTVALLVFFGIVIIRAIRKE